MRQYTVLAVTQRGDLYFMEMADGDSYELIPVSYEDAAYLHERLQAGRHIYAYGP